MYVFIFIHNYIGYIYIYACIYEYKSAIIHALNFY